MPPLIHLFYIYFALPRVGLVFPEFVCGVIGLTTYHAAFVAEILRGGINAVGRHQAESARALGLGSIPTTLHPSVMARVYALFGVPAELAFHFCIPLGYPAAGVRFGGSRRRPVGETAFLDRWGEPLLVGPGSVLVAHTDDEHVEVGELETAVDSYESIARTLLR